MNKPAFQELPADSISPQAERFDLPSLVGLNTRIEGRLSDGLIRATAGPKTSPTTAVEVQDIVGEALADWMKKHGYLN